MQRKQFARGLLVFLFLWAHSLYFLSLPKAAFAEELLNRQEMTNQISAEVNNQTSQIGSEQNTQVTNTGDNTSVESQTSNDQSTEVENNNSATVTQEVSAEANTGNNEASRNISIGGNAGMITTGDASVNTTGVVVANNNNTDVSGGGGSQKNTLGLANTGNDGTFSSSNDSKTLTSVQNNNKTVISQSAASKANTGNNKADRNISLGGAAGVIQTGNASTNTNFLVTANGNVVLIGGDSSGNGPGSGASIYIANTGNRLQFWTLSSANNQTTLNNHNQAYVSQSCGYPIANLGYFLDTDACSATTGGNTANGNIAYGDNAGVIKTGDAKVEVTMVASANNNNNQLGQSGGGSQNSLNAVNTGDDVDIETNSQTNTSTVIDNNNEAKVSQKVNAKADTGNNQANRNISFGGNAGVIDTGDACVNVNLLVGVNNNQNQVQSGASPRATQSQNTNVINTGNNSQISSENKQDTKIAVSNNNYLDLAQYVNSFANTGNNSADRNIGNQSGIINTGEAKVGVVLAVNANTNTTTIDPGLTNHLTPTPTPTTNHPTPTPTLPPAIQGTTTTTTTNSSSTTAATSGTGGIVQAATATVAPRGVVLAAATRRLPKTGPADTLLILVLSLAAYVLGQRLKASQQLKVNKFLEKGGE